MTQNKITLFIDVDDTIINSSQTVLDILTEKHKIQEKKTLNDLKDWQYRSVCKEIKSKEVQEVYSSDGFFENVKINETFLDFYKQNQDNFNFVFVTRGSAQNLSKKQEYLKNQLGNTFDYVGIDVDYEKWLYEYVDKFDKIWTNRPRKNIDMSKGIQIDDTLDCLTTSNAKLKILLKDSPLDFHWNRQVIHSDDIYIAESWKDIIEIVTFLQKAEEIG